MKNKAKLLEHIMGLLDETMIFLKLRSNS